MPEAPATACAAPSKDWTAQTACATALCSWPVPGSVGADVKLTLCAEVKVTHLGDDGSLFEAADVDSGASGGDTSNGPKGREC